MKQHPREQANQFSPINSPKEDKQKTETNYRPVKSSFQRAELVK
jgi:hypothetical protein